MNNFFESSELDPKQLLEDIIFFQKVTTETILKHWTGEKVTAETKGDNSPVTVADKEAEEVLMNAILDRYPSHGIVGEEGSATNVFSEYQWIIDPIDGTQNFINGIPTFGSMLSLKRNNEAIVGAVCHPVLNTSFIAIKGFGTFRNGQKYSLSPINHDQLRKDDLIVISTYDSFDVSNDGSLMFELLKFHNSTRIYYDCWGGTQVFEGHIAASVDFNMNIWDLMAAEVIIKELGGYFEYVRRIPGAKPSEDLYTSVFGPNKNIVQQLVNFIRPRMTSMYTNKCQLNDFGILSHCETYLT